MDRVLFCKVVEGGDIVEMLQQDLLLQACLLYITVCGCHDLSLQLPAMPSIQWWSCHLVQLVAPHNCWGCSVMHCSRQSMFIVLFCDNPYYLDSTEERVVCSHGWVAGLCTLVARIGGCFIQWLQTWTSVESKPQLNLHSVWVQSHTYLTSVRIVYWSAFMMSNEKCRWLNSHME